MISVESRKLMTSELSCCYRIARFQWSAHRDVAAGFGTRAHLDECTYDAQGCETEILERPGLACRVQKWVEE